VVEAGASASRFEHVVFEKNGARRTAMLEINADEVVVRRSVFRDAGGSSVDIQDSSPRIEETGFYRAASLSMLPPGALRIRGVSSPTVRLNFFQSTPNAPIYQDATSSPEYDGNRFEYNGWNGASIAGVVTGETRLTSLGPHRWAYWVDSGGITVNSGATLSIESGAALRFISNGLLVRGTLRVEGRPGGKVLFSSDDPDPAAGGWRDISFFDTSTDYDPATGAGSMIDHAVIEYGGSQPLGALQIDNASPRISNLMIRNAGTRGATVSGATAAPEMVGNWFVGLNAEGAGEALAVAAGAKPWLHFNVFQDNGVGVDSDSGAAPVVSPFNRFDRNIRWGVINHDSSLCVDAKDNEWGAAEGPDDPSPREDSCGLAGNTTLGDVVSDNVGYSPWAGQLTRPYITSPRCGTLRATNPVITGMAPPGTRVTVYDNYQELGYSDVGPSTGALAEFTFETDGLDTGAHVFHVRAHAPDGSVSSGVSDAVEVLVDPDAFVSASGLHIHYESDGTRYAMGVADASGCASLGSGDWEIRIHPDTHDPSVAARSTLVAPLECSAGAPTAHLLFNDERIPMAVSQGVAQAEFEPGTGGVLGVEVTCGGTTRYVALGPVSTDYEGFIYDPGGANPNPHLNRVLGAQVTLFRAEPGGSTWSRWDGAAVFGQSNPQTTGVSGWYGFYPEPGTYRVEVTHPTAGRVVSEPVTLKGQAFMLTIGLGSPKGIYLPATRMP
jgi:hypothetical protein